MLVDLKAYRACVPMNPDFLNSVWNFENFGKVVFWYPLECWRPYNFHPLPQNPRSALGLLSLFRVKLCCDLNETLQRRILLTTIQHHLLKSFIIKKLVWYNCHTCFRIEQAPKCSRQTEANGLDTEKKSYPLIVPNILSILMFLRYSFIIWQVVCILNLK